MFLYKDFLVKIVFFNIEMMDWVEVEECLKMFIELVFEWIFVKKFFIGDIFYRFVFCYNLLYFFIVFLLFVLR